MCMLHAHNMQTCMANVPNPCMLHAKNMPVTCRDLGCISTREDTYNTSFILENSLMTEKDSNTRYIGHRIHDTDSCGSFRPIINNAKMYSNDTFLSYCWLVFPKQWFMSFVGVTLGSYLRKTDRCYTLQHTLELNYICKWPDLYHEWSPMY